MRKSRRTRLPTFITWNHRFAHLQFCARITTIAQRLQGHVAASPLPSWSGGILLLAVLLRTVRHAPLHESSCSSNNLTAAPDGLSAHAHFVASSADVMRFPVPRYFFDQRAASPFGLQQHALCYMFVHRADLRHGPPAHHQAVRQRTGGFVPRHFTLGAAKRHALAAHAGPLVLTASAIWLAARITGSRPRNGPLHRCIRHSTQCGCDKCKTAARGQPFACSFVMNRYRRTVTIAPLQVHGDTLRSVQSPLPRDRRCGRLRCPACPHCAHRRTNRW